MTILNRCGCCAAGSGEFNRRHFLQLGAAAGLAAMMPSMASAGPGKYEAMLLACIDPRFPDDTFDFMKGRNLVGKYSQFNVAGAAIGVVAPKFKAWHQTFWDNLGASVQLHSINKVIVLNHMECGAATIAYGKDKTATPQAETETHKMALAQFRKEMGKRHAKMQVETNLMGLDGKVQTFA